MFAWERLKIAVFGNGLLTSITNEQVRENHVCTFASARDTACKHASNNLHGTNSTSSSSVVSTPSPLLQFQLETRLDDVQATIASLVEAPKHHKRGRSKTERRATHGSQDSSVSRRDKSSNKGKSTARRDRIPIITNIVCYLRRIRRRIVCSQNLHLKSGLTPDEAQSNVPPIGLGL